MLPGRTRLAGRSKTVAAAPPYCDQLFSQFQMEKIDGFGVRHVVDVHWKISTQPVFADVLTHQEMLPRAVPVPALGPAALAPSATDALLLACIHPVMHHQNDERLLWVYDTHLLASIQTPDNFRDFARRAQQKNVAAVCARRLRLAQTLFFTRLPADVLRELSAANDEPSAEYLASHRRWYRAGAERLAGCSLHARALVRGVLPSLSYATAWRPAVSRWRGGCCLRLRTATCAARGRFSQV